MKHFVGIIDREFTTQYCVPQSVWLLTHRPIWLVNARPRGLHRLIYALCPQWKYHLSDIRSRPWVNFIKVSWDVIE